MQIEITPAYLESQGLPFYIAHKFWLRVTLSEECWIFKGNAPEFKHQELTYSRHGRIGAHRLSWILNIGPIPTGAQVLHNCPGGDRGDCVNPEHLWLGNQSQNIKDAVKKGTVASGELHRNAKFKLMDIEDIRKSTVSHRKLAKHYNVASSTIDRICAGKTWMPSITPP